LSYTILIVDDNALIRQTLRTYLEAKTDWRVCGEAENGRIAVDKVQELKPNVVILDFQMPVMNGLDAARLIRKFAPSTVIVMLTMHESAQLRTEARNVGVEDVISKCGTFGNELLAFLTNFESKNFPTGVMVRI
jgi:DNA-binding NarL/FixJ family response regulator